MKSVGGLKPGGKGVMATAGADGAVNTAVYAFPKVVGDQILAWGMGEGRTYRNIVENPNASFLYIEPGETYHGIRLTLKIKEIRDSGELLDEIRKRAKMTSGEGVEEVVKYLALFEVVEERPLVG